MIDTTNNKAAPRTGTASTPEKPTQLIEPVNNKAAPRTGTASTPRADHTVFIEELKELSRQMIDLSARLKADRLAEKGGRHE